MLTSESAELCAHCRGESLVWEIYTGAFGVMELQVFGLLSRGQGKAHGCVHVYARGTYG